MDFKFAGNRVSVNVDSWAALRALVSDRLAQKQGFALATINLDHLVKLRTSASFRAAYQAQDFVCADGNPIVWLSTLAGSPVELIPGSDAIVPLCEIAAEQGVTVALVGSTDEALAGAARFLEQKVEGLKVVEAISPPMGFDPEGACAAEILGRVQASGARLCFVALGAPKQEVFAAFARTQTPEIGFVSIGAGLDFFAGTQTRAPEWVRRYALEWMWRALSSPRRLLPRYARCIAILPGQTLRAVWMRLQSHHA